MYEDGTPEQIFDFPQRDKTRQFVRGLKVLELNIKNKDYDFLGMAGEIEAYCQKNQISPKLKNHVQLAFEEMMQMLVPMLETPCIRAICEYSEKTDEAEWAMEYGRLRLNTTARIDDLALSVLKGVTNDIEYVWKEDNELHNLLRLKIKNVV